jgi:hypothetical protein
MTPSLRVQLLSVAKVIIVCRQSARQSCRQGLCTESFSGVVVSTVRLGETARHTREAPGQITASPQYYDKSEMTNVSDAQIAFEIGRLH